MIDLKKAREVLGKAVKTKGRDFVYNPYGPEAQCRYEPIPEDLSRGPLDPRTKTPCLVGVALDLAGETRHRAFAGNTWDLIREYPDMMTEEAATYFLEAQMPQDKGRTWGFAHDRAEAWYARHIRESERLARVA